MKLKQHNTRQRTAQQQQQQAQHQRLPDDDDDEISSGSGEDGEAEGGLTKRLLRKVPRRPGISAIDQEVVRLIGQHLTNIGLKTSADVLMQEAGCKLDQPTAAKFKKHVMAGEWGNAVKSKRETNSLWK